MRTYTAGSGGPFKRVRDFGRLYQVRTSNVEVNVAMTQHQLAVTGETFKRFTGSPLAERDVLVVGAGQTLREAVGFGIANRVVGIDLDVIPQGWRPGQYVRMFRQNGAERTAKTIGRKVLGIDRTLERKLHRALGVTTKPHVELVQMNANDMRFNAGSFDFAYSFSVFEHLDNPQAALRETIRVLRPGGVLQISTHIYTSEGGCHDLRIFAGKRDSIPLWAQLRPGAKDLVIESCYLNRWRLAEWRSLFDELCPGADITVDLHEEPRGTQFAHELAKLRDAGELGDYSDEELLMVNLIVSWRKPLLELSDKPTDCSKAIRRTVAAA